MLDKDISLLNARERVDLDGLESDIWRRERHIRALQSASRLLASWQTLVLVLAIMVSAAAGAAAAGHLVPASGFVAEESLTPSNLLLGSRR